MKKENSQNTISAKKFVKRTVCLQSSKCLIQTTHKFEYFSLQISCFNHRNKKLPISLTKNSKEVSNSVWNEEQIGTCFNRWHSPTKHNNKTFEMLKVGYWYCKIIQPFLYPFLIELIQAHQ